MGDIRTIYRTGLIVGEHEKQLTGLIAESRTWRAVAVPSRYKGSPTGSKEIRIDAPDWRRAQAALDMIRNCAQVIGGDPPIWDLHVFAHTADEPAWLWDRHPEWAEHYIHVGGFPAACRMAARVFTKRSLKYAISKYVFSQSLYSAFTVDTEPYRSHYLKLSDDPYDHVVFAHAALSAYSVVEELGLDLRSSTAKPSRINGQWNPEVRTDLESRLRRSGIDLQEKVLWAVRGPRRRLERRRPLPAAVKAEWSIGHEVRDSFLEIADAIAYADWIRDRAAAHQVNRLTTSLSPYDLVNLQYLARLLILQATGFWKGLAF